MFKKKESVKEKKYDGRVLKVVFAFFILSISIISLTIWSIFIDWKVYSNINEEFGIDLYYLFTSDAFHGPSYINSTSPATSKEISVWILHLIAILLLILSFIFTIIMFIIFLRIKKKYCKKRLEGEEEKATKKNDFSLNDGKFNDDYTAIKTYDISDEKNLVLPLSTDQTIENIENRLKDNSYNPEIVDDQQIMNEGVKEEDIEVSID